MASEVYSPRIKRSWFGLQYDEPTSTADLYLYDDIGMWGTTANDFKEQLLSLKSDKINVYINSNGGEVDAGLAIYNLLRRHSAQKTIHIDGIAASMASVIAMAGDKVVMPRTALMFVHKPWTMAAGNADDLRKTADDLNAWESALVAAYTAKTGKTAEFISDMLREERLLSAEEAVELGFADEIDEQAAHEPAAYRGAITARILCHMSKAKEKAAMTEAPPVIEEPVKPEAPVVEPVAEVKPDEQPAPVEVVPETPAPAPVDARADFKAFANRFGDTRAAAYFKEGLSFADAERRFTDELIAENAALKAEKPAAHVAGPAPVKITDSKGSLWDKYRAIPDAKGKTEFYRANKQQMDRNNK